ncbi:MAG: pyridoxamine 5'-phosphate oxidase family protein [Spirochaetota bacterium]|nr:pyridoxamine 5'-phosphate oxidase family protein [Spirochaetota bacterium]
MRRSDFQANDKDLLNRIMDQAKVGQLALTDSEGYPRIVPLNYIYTNDRVYFHGAMDGEKFTLFKDMPKVSFSVDIPYSIIPSYWSAKDYACPASTFFQSVHMRGKGHLVESLKDKAMFLQLFMEKYQPEGGYKVVDEGNPLYRKGLEETMVFEIRPVQVDIKSKFGQNLSVTAREGLIQKLRERGEKIDLLTIDEIKRTIQGE